MPTAILAVVAVTLLVFEGTLRHEFLLWDDDAYVTANPAVQAFDVRWIFTNVHFFAYIPVTLLSHALDVAVWGMKPAGHHLTNILLHAANAAWLVMVGVALWGRATRGAGRKRSDDAGASSHVVLAMAAAALLYAVHPLRAESVAWVADRKDLLCAFFFLPGLLCYLRYTAGRGAPGAVWPYVATFLLFVMAALSKTHAVVFPVVLLIVDWLLARAGDEKPAFRSLLLEKAPFLAVSAVLVIYSLANVPDAAPAHAVASLTSLESLLYPSYSVTFPLLKTLWPTGLSPIYPRVDAGVMAAAAGVFVAATVACFVAARRGHRTPLAAWAAFVVLYAPNVAGLSTGMQPVADRYSYLSTMCLFLVGGAGLAWVLAGKLWRRALAATAVFALVAILASLTMAQAGHWKSSTMLWEHVVATSPPKRDYFDAYLNLGVAYARAGDSEKAVATFRRAGEIDPANAEAPYNAGSVLLDAGNYEGAFAELRRAIQLNPKHPGAYYHLAIAADRLGLGDQALAAMIQAARLGHPAAQRELSTRGIAW